MERPLLSFADRYHELLAYRRKELKKYRLLQSSDLGGPPPKIIFPKLSFTQPQSESVKIGPIWFSQDPPSSLHQRGTRLPYSTKLVDSGVRTRKRHARVDPYFEIWRLDFGLLRRGRDRTVSGDYERIDSISRDVSIGMLLRLKQSNICLRTISMTAFRFQ